MAPALPSQPTPRGCALSSDRAELPSAGLASGEGTWIPSGRRGRKGDLDHRTQVSTLTQRPSRPMQETGRGAFGPPLS